MKKLAVVWAGIFLASIFTLHAQTAIPVRPVFSHAPVPSSSDDLNTMLEAVEATTPMAADAVPVSGTFQSAQNPLWPPLPGNIHSSPAWDLGEGVWLLDDLDVDYTAATPLLSSRGGMHAMFDGPPGPGDGGGDTNSYDGGFAPAYSFPTNNLWLQITNVSSGLAYLNLMNATNSVYEIISKTDLLLTNWTIEQEVWPTNPAVMPFIVPELNRTNLFIWARDWTGITSLGNTTPEWWFWKYFQTVTLSDTNLDSQGATLLHDYTNSLDPNIIAFSITPTNSYVNTTTISVPLKITAGVPSYYAVLVNASTATNWQPFVSTNLAVYLGSTDGVYAVNVGLRGLPANATQTWTNYSFTLDRVAPTVTVTNPVGGTVSVPMIQLQGFANEMLSQVTFGVSNAAGILTNQTGYVTDEFWDTNRLAFTTNYFQCYDIALTNGANLITVHATDLAGNIATTNVSVTVDYSGDHTAPVLSAIWPQNGTHISGSNFTFQAQMDDYTATVRASIVNASGDTNLVPGLVERSGKVSIGNLPMSAGTNTLTVTATDAAGNTTTTNMTLTQSSVMVTLDPLSGDQANQSSVSVTGTISDPSGDVCIQVNGTNAYYLDDIGDWEADNVPVSPSGTATFDVELYTNDPVNIGSQVFQQVQTPTVVLSDFKQNSTINLLLQAAVQWNYADGGNWSSADDPGGLIPPDGNGYAPPVVTSDYGETFAPAWQNADATYDNGALFQTLDHTTVMIAPSGPKLPGVPKTYTVRVRAEQFSPLISHPSGGDYGFFGPLLAANVYSYGNAPVPSAQLLVNGQPLSGSVTNNDGPLWYQNIWGQATVSAPAGVPLPLKVTSTNPTNNDYTFGVEIVQDKLYWQNQVQSEIDTDSGVVIENYLAGKGFLNNRQNIQAVYKFYEKLFVQNTNFLWAGLAKLAGAPVYAGLSDAQYLKVGAITSGFLTLDNLGGTIASGLLASKAAQFQTNLLVMNIHIYQDLDWQFEAYEKGGLDALEEINAAVGSDQNVISIEAWREIDEGIQDGDDAEIQDGNMLLAQREQEVILVNDYEILSGIFPGTSSLMSIFAQNPVTGGPSFNTLEPSGNIANTTNRWDWVSRSYTSIFNTGIFPLWLQKSDSSRLLEVEQPLRYRAQNDFSLVYEYFGLTLF